MKFTILIIFTLFIFPHLSAQEEWMSFTYGEFVTDLASDSNYLWIGTMGGLVKFDKQTEKMTFFNKANVLPSNHVLAVSIDSSHNIWIGTGRGLTKYDGRNWYTFNTENSGLPSNTIYAIAVDSANTLYIGSGGWFTIYDGQNWKSILTGEWEPWVGFYDIKFDSWGNVWIGASWGVGIFKNDSITIIGDYISAGINVAHCLAIDSLDNIWVGDSYNGLFKYDGSWTHYDTSNSEIPDNTIYDLYIDKEGNLWGAAYASLFKYAGENWEIYNSDNSILPPYESYFCLEFDTDNTLWLGTGSGSFGNGLYKFNGIDWKHYSTSSSGLLINLPYSIITDDRGYLWVGYLGWETIQQYNGSSWPTYTVEDADFFNSQFNLICNEDSTKIWQGHGMILLFIGKNFAGIYSDKTKMISDYVKSDANGNIWIITSAERIKKYDGQQWTIYTQENTGIPFTDVEKIAFSPSGTAYISSDLGFLTFDRTNWELLPVNLFTSQSDGFIYSTFSFDQTGIMWLGIPGEGLIKYDGNQKSVYLVTGSDVPLDIIQDLDFDQAGNLWIATQDYGLVKFDKNNTWEIYNRNTSGKSSDFLIMEMEIDINDNVWFLSEWDGLCVFREGGIIYPSSVTYNQPSIPSKFYLFQNYPNPFNPQTTISFSIPQSGHVSVKIYDLTGRLVRALTNGYNTAGLHSIVWHGRNENGIEAASGMYIYQVKYQGRVLNKKLLLIR